MQYAAAKQWVSDWERVWWDFNEVNQDQHAETRWATVGASIFSGFCSFVFFSVCHSHFVFVYFPASFFKGGRMCLLLFLCPSSCSPPVIPLSAMFIWSSRAPCVREALIQPKPHLNKSHSRICFFSPQEVWDILKRLLDETYRLMRIIVTIYSRTVELSVCFVGGREWALTLLEWIINVMWLSEVQKHTDWNCVNHTLRLAT